MTGRWIDEMAATLIRMGFDKVGDISYYRSKLNVKATINPYEGWLELYLLIDDNIVNRNIFINVDEEKILSAINKFKNGTAYI